MEARTGRRLEFEELKRRLRAAEPGAVLAPARILRRVIKHDREMMGFTLHVPHRKCYTLSGKSALEIVDRDELDLGPHDAPPEQILFLESLDSERLASIPESAVLAMYWRLLFHASIHARLESRFARGEITDQGLFERIAHLGPLVLEEARYVLQQEGLLLPPGDSQTAYIEFVAVYQDLRCFAPDRLATVFPSITDHDAVSAWLDHEVNGPALMSRTRLEGAPPPPHADYAMPDDGTEELEHYDEVEPERLARKRKRFQDRQLRKASKVRDRGNVVRAALALARADLANSPKNSHSFVTMQETTEATPGTAELDVLILRLQEALALDEDETQAWREAIRRLLVPAARSWYPQEARLLYDLQKICVDFERPLSQLDTISWIFSLGRIPLRRDLPYQRAILTVKNLRNVLQRTRKVKVTEEERNQLLQLAQQQLNQVEHAVREELRPVVESALDEVELVAKNLPEQAARGKTIEEILDHTVTHGYVSYGNLRDAISRNRLKLDDVASARELLVGDKLLRADRLLGQSLLGVYRQGEVYFRWLQRLSSLSFGSKAGRILTKYLMLPFGGAYLILAGLDHTLIHLLGMAFESLHHFHLQHNWSVLLLGVFLFGIIHSGVFRTFTVNFFHTLYLAARGMIIDLPSWIMNNPLMRAILRSPIVRWSWKLLLKPSLLTLLFYPAIAANTTSWEQLAPRMAGMFAVICIFLNMRAGRDLQEIAADVFAKFWYSLIVEVIPSVVRLSIDFFMIIMEWFEKFLYMVDQSLRFRVGESRLTLVFKAVFGVFWSIFQYLARFVVNLLAEPQLNPVKHFPVVTVAHKLILPFAWILAEPLRTHGWDKEAAYSFSLLIFALIPGVFGFFAWELKENWRIYRANQALRLRPVVIGGHGENVLRMLKPGFHSGTIPKLFSKLRSAERRAFKTGRRSKLLKFRAAMHHTHVEIENFLNRELLALLAKAELFPFPKILTEHLHLANNSITITLSALFPAAKDAEANTEANADAPAMVLRWEFRQGWLIARVLKPGWYLLLGPQQQALFLQALWGLYQMAGIDLVHEQIVAYFGGLPLVYSPSDDQLEVWPGARLAAHRMIPLTDHPLTEFTNSITWANWVDFWNNAARGNVVLNPVTVRNLIALDRPAPHA